MGSVWIQLNQPLSGFTFETSFNLFVPSSHSSPDSTVTANMGGSEVLYESSYETMVPTTGYKQVRTTSSTEGKGQYMNQQYLVTTRGVHATGNGQEAEDVYAN